MVPFLPNKKEGVSYARCCCWSDWIYRDAHVTYRQEERIEIERAIRMALRNIDLTLPIKESLRLWLFR